jgi:hypothetical protein
MNIIIGPFGPIVGDEHGYHGQDIRIIMTPEEARTYAAEMARSYSTDGILDTARVARVLSDALRSMLDGATTPSLVLPVSSMPASQFESLLRKPR